MAVDSKARSSLWRVTKTVFSMPGNLIRSCNIAEMGCVQAILSGQAYQYPILKLFEWDYPTVMMVGRELEPLNVAWFEEPPWCDDIPGHARLADALDIPIEYMPWVSGAFSEPMRTYTRL